MSDFHFKPMSDTVHALDHNTGVSTKGGQYMTAYRTLRHIKKCANMKRRPKCHAINDPNFVQLEATHAGRTATVRQEIEARASRADAGHEIVQEFYGERPAYEAHDAERAYNAFEDDVLMDAERHMDEERTAEEIAVASARVDAMRNELTKVLAHVDGQSNTVQRMVTLRKPVTRTQFLVYADDEEPSRFAAKASIAGATVSGRVWWSVQRDCYIFTPNN